jgi:hypothetical protein
MSGLNEYDADVNEKLDVIVKLIESFVIAGSFDDLNTWLQAFRVDDMAPDVLIGALTTTLPVKAELPFRKRFYHNVVNSFEQRGVPVEIVEELK